MYYCWEAPLSEKVSCTVLLLWIWHVDFLDIDPTQFSFFKTFPNKMLAYLVLELQLITLYRFCSYLMSRSMFLI